MRTILALPILLTALPALAQEAVTFGAWRAFCAPTAGCVLGVKTLGGDTLAFIEPPSNDDRLLLIPKVDPRPGSEIVLSFDGARFATLGPADGWRRIESDVGPAIQIAPSVVREGLSDSMRRKQKLEIDYTEGSGSPRRIVFSLNGFTDTRSFADDG